MLENRGIEDNEWTQGEENKGRMGGGGCIMRGSLISTIRVVLLGRSNQKGCAARIEEMINE